MFYITISNGLLTKEHKNRMGSAVWEFMWCLDKVTKVDSKGRGLVLGGKPVQLHEIDMGHDNTTSRNIQKLIEQKYIETLRTPYGMVIHVLKAKKRFTKNGESLKMVPTNNGESPTGNGESPTNNGGYKEDIAVDSTVDIAEYNAPTSGARPLKVKKDRKKDITPFSQSEFITSMRASPHRHMNLIAEYADQISPDLKTKGQWYVFMSRNLRTATDLAPFTDDQIAKAFSHIKKNIRSKENPKGYITKWGLETLLAYIHEK